MDKIKRFCKAKGEDIEFHSRWAQILDKDHDFKGGNVVKITDGPFWVQEKDDSTKYDRAPSVIFEAEVIKTGSKPLPEKMCVKAVYYDNTKDIPKRYDLLQKAFIRLLAKLQSRRDRACPCPRV